MKFYGYTLNDMYWAAERCITENNLELLKVLMKDFNLDLNKRPKSISKTLLYAAIESEDVKYEVVEFLVKNGACVNAYVYVATDDIENWMPILDAMSYDYISRVSNKEKIKELLVQHGAKHDLYNNKSLKDLDTTEIIKKNCYGENDVVAISKSGIHNILKNISPASISLFRGIIQDYMGKPYKEEVGKSL